MVAYSFKRMFVPAIRMGLGLEPIDPASGARRAKLHTIRAGSIHDDGFAYSPKGRRHAWPYEQVQLYVGMRTKQCELIGRAQCSAVKPIALRFSANGMAAIVGDKLIGPRKIEAFAQSDGFETSKDMSDFWAAEHGLQAGWEGVIIYWEPFP